MFNKYTLKFSDPKIEESYQEYLTITVRKFILGAAIISMTLWSTIDMLQLLIQQQLKNDQFELIISTYVSNYAMIGILALIYYFKIDYIRWALLISNHFLAYSYWNQDRIYDCQQSHLNTVILMGSQMLILITSDFIEMLYQVLLFSCIYLMKMLLESNSLKISLLVAYFLASTSFIMILYQIQKNLREQFKIRYTNDLWEKIFMTLQSGKFLTFDYDFATYSFNFGKQHNFNQDITDTKTLRNYLRSMFVNDKKQTLESYLHAKLTEDKIPENNLIETLPIHNGKSKTTTLKITIFFGKRKERALTANNLFKRFKIILTKNIIFSKEKNKYDILKELKKCWIYEHLKENLYLFLNSQEQLTRSKFSLLTLLQKIKNLYPKRKIDILNPSSIEIILNNKSLITTIFVDIIENVLSSEIKIQLNYLSIKFIQIKFHGFVNDKSYQNISQIAGKYQNFIEAINIDLTGVQVILNNENIKEMVIQVNQREKFPWDGLDKLNWIQSDKIKK